MAGIGLVFGALLNAPEVHARPPEGAESVYLVELVDPATPSFVDAAQLTAADPGTRAQLSPTAPRVTGQARLDVKAPEVQRFAAYLDRRRAEVLNRAHGALGRELSPRAVFRHAFNGFSAELSEAEAARLAQLPGVRRVVRAGFQRVLLDAGPEWIEADRVWGGLDGSPATRGEGVVIGVIDTGINWENFFFDPDRPSAGNVSNSRGRFYGLCNQPGVRCNDKLIGVYDFTDEGSNGFDPDTHGSHVASIAAGISAGSLPLEFGNVAGFYPSVSGVAPAANLISYKACRAPDDPGQSGFVCPSEDTIEALEQAIADQVDVINYSIGGPPIGDPWADFGVQGVMLNVREAGIVPVVAAGNDGPGAGTVGRPANAPWVVAVANVFHDRRSRGARLDSFVGGESPLPTQVIGFSVNDTQVGRTDIVHAGAFGFPFCAQGNPGGNNCNAGAAPSNPFQTPLFNGQIVVCDYDGGYGINEIARNVRAAGAAGLIIANTDALGEESGFGQQCLPTIQVGDQDGDQLRRWLASGSGHQAILRAAARLIDPGLSGQVARSSSRGPDPGAPGLMKPNLAAPGTDVLGAATDFQNGGPGPGAANLVALLTGTSMASPHVAGAAALVRSAHPSWPVDAVISALETTADPAIVAVGSEPGDWTDFGAGGVQVNDAIRAGLYLPVTSQQFLNANPSAGGDPSALNLAGLVSAGCTMNCRFTRTVRALAAGTWTVQSDGDVPISVSPQSFSLQPGQQRVLTIDVDTSSAPLGSYARGSVRLVPGGSSALATQRLPVEVYVAGREVPASSGQATIRVANAPASSLLNLSASALVRPVAQQFTLPADPTPGNPFDNDSGVATVLVDVPAGTLALDARTPDSPAADIDLFVGRDRNDNGRADADEVACASTSPNEIEDCLVTDPEPGPWWILVQNWQASASGASDPVPLEYTVYSGERDASFVVAGPGRHDGGELLLDAWFDQPAMRRSEEWRALVGIGSSPQQRFDIDTIIVSITRTDRAVLDAVPLFAGQKQIVTLPGNSAHRKLFIDVPDNVESFVLTATGDVARISMRRMSFAEATANPPQIPEAPGAVLADAQRSGDQWTLAWGSPGAAADAGRYYFVLENDAATERQVELEVQVVEQPAPGVRRGLWGFAGRSIGQGLDWEKAGANQFAVWYSYDETGLPTFYITDTVQPAQDSAFFQAVLFRPTGDGENLLLKKAGRVQLTILDQERVMFSWWVNGHRGAEALRPVIDDTCLELDGQPAWLTGHWVVSGPTKEGGLTGLVSANNEAWIRYFYDSRNIPRWFLADVELAPTLPGGMRMEALDFRGFCIYCDPVPVTNRAVGTLERVFQHDRLVRDVSAVSVDQGFGALIFTDRNLERITDDGACAP
ncbi:MAG: S8 family serine peptidase [Wenzhouxiangellaceae bacterium]